MEKENNKQSIKDSVLNAIKSGRAKMLPRWHFVLKGVLLAIGVLLLAFLLLYLVSFIVFSMHQTGVWFVPVFGLPGWFSFLRHIPWILIGLSLLFIIVLEILVRRYSFTYRKPLLYSVFAIVLIAGIVGIFAAPLHRGFFLSMRFGGKRPPRPSIPFLDNFYRSFGFQRLDDVHRGTITEMIPAGFVMENFGGETSTIIISSGTRLLPINDFEVGDTVTVFGEENGNSVQAVGIREISD
ncbi:MAG: hypothetical protein KGJ89_04080 [Patescibacteria group bacterium]|nr:hypothetical protein [Patescibacteria group bacterium]MDE2015304.1 hypothetical protein [Patescibacteria group bacterium]MDE2227109.1 hypothetical protein [Patescibacteria group bacterium]